MLSLPFSSDTVVSEAIVRKAFFDAFRQEFAALIPNTFLLGWEADILAIDAHKKAHEFEIKLSAADFKNDARKTRVLVREENLSEVSHSLESKYDALLEGKRAHSFSYILPAHLQAVVSIPMPFGVITWNAVEEEGLFRMRFSVERSAQELHHHSLSEAQLFSLLTSLADHRFAAILQSDNDVLAQRYAELKRKYDRLKRRHNAEMEAKEFISDWNQQFDHRLQQQWEWALEVLTDLRGLLSEQQRSKLDELLGSE